MSHFHERKEKDCLNCGAEVQGRYCQVCGQENIEPKETFWHLLTHFVYDITHFDGKFFSSLKYLLFRPGFLSKEYLKGRRASYLHPIRMYVFVSAFFFLIFFSFYQSEKEYVRVNETGGDAARVMKKLKKNRADLVEMINDTTSLEITRTSFQRMLPAIDSDIAILTRDTSAKAIDSLKTVKSRFTVISFSKSAKNYKTAAAYDSAQEKLPETERDNFIVKGVEHQNYHLREKYDNDKKATMKAIVDKFKHSFPQMMFVSMPLYALALQLLYIRRRKDIYYVNHIVYTLHLFCATFIILLAAMFLTSLFKLLHWYTDDVESVVSVVFTLAGLFYWYKSMRNFYEQRRKKTVLKYILAMILSLFIVLLMFIVFFLFSVMTI